LLVWAVAAALGIAALLHASAPAFTALKLAGAAYLVVLGLQALRAAFSGRDGATIAARGREPLAPRTAYRQGLLSDLGNPKMAVFFTSLLPQFAPQHGSAFATMLALGLLFCALTFAWLVAYSVAVAKASDVLRRPRIRRTIEGLTGAPIVALALRVATAHR
jgi:threonine/homoserine/homoserine lactone efflux protein